MVSRVTIHYRRPPDRVQIFDQLVLERTPDYTVTFLPRTELTHPVTAAGRVILDPGAPVVWFTYPGLWHDIGRFHLANEEFTGYYANILTPVVMEDDGWETTDLFLDLWVPANGEAMVLDEEELDQAVELGWVDEATAERARHHARELLEGARKGQWPPEHVERWTIDRARDIAARISD